MTEDERNTLIDVPASIDIANARRNLFGAGDCGTYCHEFQAQMRLCRIRHNAEKRGHGDRTSTTS